MCMCVLGRLCLVEQTINQLKCLLNNNFLLYDRVAETWETYRNIWHYLPKHLISIQVVFVLSFYPLTIWSVKLWVISAHKSISQVVCTQVRKKSWASTGKRCCFIIYFVDVCETSKNPRVTQELMKHNVILKCCKDNAALNFVSHIFMFLVYYWDWRGSGARWILQYTLAITSSTMHPRENTLCGLYLKKRM